MLLGARPAHSEPSLPNVAESVSVFTWNACIFSDIRSRVTVRGEQKTRADQAFAFVFAPGIGGRGVLGNSLLRSLLSNKASPQNT